jgi:histidyl-tRNA synthetase
MEAYNFGEIRTPIIEPTELIARGVGELTDIVAKEMFSFERGSTNYVLRPEITAPVMRACLQHSLGQNESTQKLFYMGPCFRAERPQKGRYRQFHQFGAEVVGASGAAADVEIISLMMSIYKKLGLSDFRLRINSLGNENCRPAYKAALAAYLEPHRATLSETSRTRLEANPLRILDTKDPDERQLLEGAPVLSEFLDESSQEHHDEVRKLLDDLGIVYVEDPYLVRGLDYYTKTAFELESDRVGAQSALAGGGRYDLLATELGAKSPLPAVGFAAGFERLFLALEDEKIRLATAHYPDLYLVSRGERAHHWVVVRAKELRDRGVSVEIDFQERSVKAQMREANRLNARFVAVVGDDELLSGDLLFKNMSTSEELQLSTDHAAEEFCAMAITL